jgi:hypothetical protein
MGASGLLGLLGLNGFDGANGFRKLKGLLDDVGEGDDVEGAVRFAGSKRMMS